MEASEPSEKVIWGRMRDARDSRALLVEFAIVRL